MPKIVPRRICAPISRPIGANAAAWSGVRSEVLKLKDVAVRDASGPALTPTTTDATFDSTKTTMAITMEATPSVRGRGGAG